MAIDLSQAPGEVLLNGNYVWDAGSLAWVKETQPGGGGGGGGPATIADGADVAEGATTDAAVVTDTTGTISGKLRGLVKIFADVWDSGNSRLKVDGSGVTQPVSGTVTASLAAGTNNIGDVDVFSLPIDTYSAKAVVANSSGNNTIHTPTSGNRIRLGYIVLSADGANTADVTATVKFAAGGASLYTISLKAGSMWARNVGAGRRYLDGGTNNALIVSLSAAQTVNVSIEYDEST